MEATCPCGLLLDPYIFATPRTEAAEAVRRFLLTLVSWGRALRNNEVSTSAKALSALRVAGLYPDFDWTKRVLLHFRIEDLSAVDVQAALRVLADRAPYAEDRLGFRDVAGTIGVQPVLVEERVPRAVSDAFGQVLVGAIYWCQTNNCALPCVGTVDVPAEELRVVGTVDLLEHADGRVDPPLRQAIDELFSLLQQPAHLLRTDASDHVVAIQFVHENCLRASDPTVPALGAVKLGPRFAESVKRHGLATQRVLLAKLHRTCALAAVGRLAQVAGAKLHAVRESEAGAAPQVTREGGARKWRCMLTRGGAGYRLQYWQCPDGSIELDEVLLESEV